MAFHFATERVVTRRRRRARQALALGIGFAAAVVLASCGDTEGGGSGQAECERWCERLRTTDCPGSPATADPELCSSECQQLLASVQPSCRPELSRLLSCLQTVPLECIDGACLPEDGPDCVPVLPRGCSDEDIAFTDCYAPDDCKNSSGGGSFDNQDGERVDFDVSSECGECPEPLPATSAPGGACSSSLDCAGICCTCPTESLLVRACIGGKCADQGASCSGDIQVCTP